MEFISAKTTSMELRMDSVGGLSWDVLRHVTQHFHEFDPSAGGSALFDEFLTQKRWSLLSGPISAWTQEESKLNLSNAFFPKFFF